jgi:sensor histidine kinase YesM
MIFAPVSMIAVYIALHILLPYLIYPAKYLSLLGTMVVLTVFYFSIAWFITYIFAKFTQTRPYHELPTSFRWFLPIRYGIGFPLTSTLLVVILKLFKNFHLKLKENELLLRQKINNELQLLKTRFRPQFLYNALLHISDLIQKQSDESPAILIKLSELLSYVLYEYDKETVPLENELETLKTFIKLKNTFHPQDFVIQYNQQVWSKQLFIAPLLLLSIMENCLDNLIQFGERPIFLNLIVKTTDDELFFQLECKGIHEYGLLNMDFYNHLMDASGRLKLLSKGTKAHDIFTENGTTYFIFVFNLAKIPGLNTKVHEMPITA